MSAKTYIGIDPGKSGALCIINDDGVVAVPYDRVDYIEMLSGVDAENSVCCLERVSAMPGQGVTSMFSFGENFGFLQGVLETLHIPYELVRPQKWKKEFSITADKNSSVDVCKRLLPSLSLKKTDRCKKDDDGLAEAALMAIYAKRNL